MEKIPVFFDCDTGTDDAAAILIAGKMSEIEIVGLGAVCGNVGLEHTYPNTCRVAKLAGIDAPVYKGAEEPMFRPLVKAEYVHAVDGLGGKADTISDIPVPEAPKTRAWDAIYNEAVKHNGELVVVAVGPMTDLGIALAKYKELPNLIKKVYIMGGSASFGNITPAAEFNIYVDPEAAKMLFESGIPIYMCGLDVTEKAYLTPEEMDEIGKIGTRATEFIADVCRSSLEFYLTRGYKGKFMHDSCPMLAVVHPEIFSGKMAGVAVETKGKITLGKTVSDYYTDRKFDFENAFVVTDVDREKFVELTLEYLKK